jgi:hypothetical protein
MTKGVNLNEKILQPLKMDIGRFKREFNRLSKMTTFQRALDVAIDKKADRWLDYVPLSKAQLFDTPYLDKPITVLRPMANGSLAPARSTFRGAMQEQISILHRPTEAIAILHAMGFFVLPSDLAVIRVEPIADMRYCILCKKHHLITEFAQNKHFPNGIHFACKRSLGENNGGFWRRAG